MCEVPEGGTNPVESIYDITSTLAMSVIEGTSHTLAHSSLSSNQLLSSILV